MPAATLPVVPLRTVPETLPAHVAEARRQGTKEARNQRTPETRKTEKHRTAETQRTPRILPLAGTELAFMRGVPFRRLGAWPEWACRPSAGPYPPARAPLRFRAIA